MDSGLPILWDLDFVFLFVMIAPCIRLRRNGYLPVAEWLSAYGGMVISATRKMKVNFLALLGNFRLIKKLESLIKLFKVCGFLRQSLEPPSAEGGTLSVLQTDCVPQAVWKE